MVDMSKYITIMYIKNTIMAIHKEIKVYKEMGGRGLAKADACGRGGGAGG